MTAAFVERTSDGTWHYRRSLASRVTLLTTIAVGLVVAMLSVTTYALMRHQLVANTDDSLTERARAAATSSALLVLTQNEIPAAVVSTADIRIAFVDATGGVHIPDRVGGFPPLSTPELNVAQQKVSSSIRTISSGNQKYRVVAVPTMVTGEPRALVLAQALTPQEHLLHRLGLVMLF